eukprot:13276827-Alexandrium_andersonii.AAC.1
MCIRDSARTRDGRQFLAVHGAGAVRAQLSLAPDKSSTTLLREARGSSQHVRNQRDGTLAWQDSP